MKHNGLAVMWFSADDGFCVNACRSFLLVAIFLCAVTKVVEAQETAASGSPSRLLGKTELYPFGIPSQSHHEGGKSHSNNMSIQKIGSKSHSPDYYPDSKGQHSMLNWDDPHPSELALPSSHSKKGISYAQSWERKPKEGGYDFIDQRGLGYQGGSGLGGSGRKKKSNGVAEQMGQILATTEEMKENIREQNVVQKMMLQQIKDKQYRYPPKFSKMNAQKDLPQPSHYSHSPPPSHHHGNEVPHHMQPYQHPHPAEEYEHVDHFQAPHVAAPFYNPVQTRPDLSMHQVSTQGHPVFASDSYYSKGGYGGGMLEHGHNR